MKNKLHFLAVTWVIFISFTCAFSQITFNTQSTYKYLKGINAAGLSSEWMQPAFDDSGWASSPAPFRYGDGTGGTELTDMLNSYSTIYLRSKFNAYNTGLIYKMTFQVNYDDGFIIWINGKKVIEQNAPVDPFYNSFAPANHEFGTFEPFVINTSDFQLQDGENTIAVQVFNVGLSSSDVYFDMQFNAITEQLELMDSIGIKYSHPSGFYNLKFNLILTSPDASANLVYTLDGSNPQTSPTRFSGGPSDTVYIDPSISNGRGITPAVVVRASITKDGYRPSKPSSRTFIYIDKVKTQSYPGGGGWPSTSVINDQMIDLSVDSRVTSDSRYTNLIDDAFYEIPTISIITDIENLFDPASGIYVNAGGHGFGWEKDCSVELINPDKSEGFNVNAGLRIRGGWSRHGDFPKHAFRLFFRKEYGNAKLYFPLFGNEGVSEFDKIDLRCEQNYAWSNGDSRNTAVREVFSRDTQRDMGQPYTRSRYYHLFLNGMYWGLYQTQERSEARYASDYFGDKSENYDVIKVNTENWGYTIEATDGDLTAWQKLYYACNSGFGSNKNYFKLEGKTFDGKPDPSGEVQVDIDNLIDYMLVIFYTGNFDAPTSSFGSNKGANNFFAINDRIDKSKGFVFLNHDAEHSMFSETASPGTGLYENRVNLGSRTDGLKMEVTGFNSFHPQWLHYRLSFNSEYKMRFIDRAYKIFEEGSLTVDSCKERFKKRIAEIDTAIIAESARWGDAKSGTSYTKDNNWIPELNKVLNVFISQRTNIVIDQLADEGLYTPIHVPSVKKAGIEITTDKYLFDAPFTVKISSVDNFKIYYTLNGTDPRLIGGGISPDALEINGSTDMAINKSAILSARAYNNSTWSALKHIDFLSINEDYSNLKITELHYDPQGYINGTDTIPGKDFEFIEFKNTGESAINLSGLMLDSAVYYEFPQNAILGSKQFYVIASKPSKFFERHRRISSGNFKGNLSNEGEEILLRDVKGNAIIHFYYTTSSPWPSGVDSTGFTLVSGEFNPSGDPQIHTYWRKSYLIDGSPFRDDDGTSGIESLSDLNPGVNIYPVPASDYVNIEIPEKIGKEFKIELYNLNGQKLFEDVVYGNARVNLQALGLDAGIYLLKVQGENNPVFSKIIYAPR